MIRSISAKVWLIGALVLVGASGVRAQVATQPSTAPQQTIYSDWLQLDPAIAGTPDAAVRMGYAWTAFFKGGNYQVHSSTGQTAGAVWRLADLAGWPTAWDAIDAAYEIDGGTVALIRGTEYLQLHFDPEQGTFLPAGAPEPLIPDGSGAGFLPEDWGGRIDTAVRWDAKNVMFFRGDEYIVLDLEARTVSEATRMSGWPGWPAGWDRIDAATNPGYGAVYFVRGSEYITCGTSMRAHSCPIRRRACCRARRWSSTSLTGSSRSRRVAALRST
jgi:hypothetical protein